MLWPELRPPANPSQISCRAGAIAAVRLSVVPTYQPSLRGRSTHSCADCAQSLARSQVCVTDNVRVNRDTCCSASTPAIRYALRKAKRPRGRGGGGFLAVDIGVRSRPSKSARSTCGAARSQIVRSVNQRDGAETNAIRARVTISKTDAGPKAEANSNCPQNLGAAFYYNTKGETCLAAIQSARLSLSNTTVIAPADGVVTTSGCCRPYVNQPSPAELIKYARAGSPLYAQEPARK